MKPTQLLTCTGCLAAVRGGRSLDEMKASSTLDDHKDWGSSGNWREFDIEGGTRAPYCNAGEMNAQSIRPVQFGVGHWRRLRAHGYAGAR